MPLQHLIDWCLIRPYKPSVEGALVFQQDPVLLPLGKATLLCCVLSLAFMAHFVSGLACWKRRRMNGSRSSPRPMTDKHWYTALSFLPCSLERLTLRLYVLHGLQCVIVKIKLQLPAVAAGWVRQPFIGCFSFLASHSHSPMRISFQAHCLLCCLGRNASIFPSPNTPQ